jgi:Ser/Thr protein kinase RdoA (MazF antagonist)
MSFISSIPFARIIHLPRPGWLSDYFSSRMRSLDIELATVHEILQHYGLELVKTPRNLPNTRRNHNLIVETNAGRKILKLYRSDWRQATIAYEHSILQHLAEIEFPAPRLSVAQNDDTWLVLGKHSYCLFDFIPGVNYSSSFLIRPQRVQMMATSGRTLARLHLSLRGFSPQGQHHLGFESYELGRHRDIAWHTHKVVDLISWSQNLADAESLPHTSWLIERSPELLNEMRALDDGLQAAGLPRVIIHGDYGLHNLLYQSLDQAVPVDFELARLEWRLSDLVSVVSKFRYQNGSYDFESIDAFMRAYQQEYPIGDEEWIHFPQVWKFYKLMKAVQYWGSYFETNGPARKLASARDEIYQSNWAFENPARLASFRGAAP